MITVPRIYSNNLYNSTSRASDGASTGDSTRRGYLAVSSRCWLVCRSSWRTTLTLIMPLKRSNSRRIPQRSLKPPRSKLRTSTSTSEVSKVSLAYREPTDRMVRQDYQAPLERQEGQDRQGRLVLRANLVHQGSKGLKVYLVSPDRKASKDSLDRRGQMGLKVRRVTRAIRAAKVMQAKMAQPVLPALKVLRVQQASKARQDSAQSRRHSTPALTTPTTSSLPMLSVRLERP